MSPLQTNRTSYFLFAILFSLVFHSLLLFFLFNVSWSEKNRRIQLIEIQLQSVKIVGSRPKKDSRVRLKAKRAGAAPLVSKNLSERQSTLAKFQKNPRTKQKDSTTADATESKASIESVSLKTQDDNFDFLNRLRKRIILELQHTAFSAFIPKGEWRARIYLTINRKGQLRDYKIDFEAGGSLLTKKALEKAVKASFPISVHDFKGNFPVMVEVPIRFKIR